MPIKSAGSIWRRRSRTSFDPYQWQALLYLSQQKRPLGESLKLLEDRRNKDLIAQLTAGFVSGRPARELFAGLKDPIGAQLAFYLTFMPLTAALRTALSISRFESETKEKLKKILFYPLTIMFFAIAVLIMFTYLVIPRMLELLAGAGPAERGTLFLIYALNAACLALIFLFVSALALAIYLRSGDHILRAWAMLHRLRQDRLIRKYATYLFARYLDELQQQGLSTRQALAVMISYSTKPVIVFLAKKLRRGFEKGCGFEEALEDEYFDDRFRLIARMGCLTDTFSASLREYQRLFELGAAQGLKRASAIISGIAYACIGLIVIAVYRALMMPLSMLEEI